MARRADRRVSGFLIISQERPVDPRRHVLGSFLAGVGIGDDELDRLVEATGPTREAPGFTFSDLTQRLLPGIVLDAYPDRPIDGARAVRIAEGMKVTPSFRDEAPAIEQRR